MRRSIVTIRYLTNMSPLLLQMPEIHQWTRSLGPIFPISEGYRRRINIYNIPNWRSRWAQRFYQIKINNFRLKHVYFSVHAFGKILFKGNLFICMVTVGAVSRSSRDISILTDPARLAIVRENACLWAIFWLSLIGIQAEDAFHVNNKALQI